MDFLLLGPVITCLHDVTLSQLERSIERVCLVWAATAGRVAFNAASAVLRRVRRRAVAAVQRHRAQVVVRPGRHREPAITESAAVGRRVDAAEAQTRHGRGEIQVGRDGAQRPRVTGVRHIEVVTARQTCLHHRFQTVDKQLRVVLVLRCLPHPLQVHVQSLKVAEPHLD